MKKKLLGLLLVATSLITIVSVYGFSFITPPQQNFKGSGITYAVEYECGELQYNANVNAIAVALNGNYTTNILVHNNLDSNQSFYVKFVPALTVTLVVSPSQVGTTTVITQGGQGFWVQNPASIGPSFRFILSPDGALDIDCSEILTAYASREYVGVVIFTKGLLIISQLNVGEKASPAPMDVRASYTYQAFAPYNGQLVGGNIDVITVTGVPVKNAPLPPCTTGGPCPP